MGRETLALELHSDQEGHQREDLLDPGKHPSEGGSATSQYNEQVKGRRGTVSVEGRGWGLSGQQMPSRSPAAGADKGRPGKLGWMGWRGQAVGGEGGG